MHGLTCQLFLKFLRLWRELRPASLFQVTAALASVMAPWIPAVAQTPGATVSIPRAEQPVPGPGQGPGFDRDDRTEWSRHPTGTPVSPRGWREILLADINGDGRDDLCGSYGLANGQRAYGCVINDQSRRFTGPLLQAAAFNGALDPTIHPTIRVVDLHDNGERHLCGRTMEGIKCQRFNGTFFEAPVLVHTMFSDANFWNQVPYASTIGFARLNNALALCGRGVIGVMCFRKSGAVFNRYVDAWALDFSDANGWNNPEYFSTLRYVDINRDGQSDICARGTSGILCAMYRASRFNRFSPAQWTTTQFADWYGWNDARYFPSVRFGDISGDGLADVCGRGSAGLYCGINNSYAGNFGSLIGVGTLAQPQMSDANNWGSPTANLSSLLIADYDGDGKNDVCGLNAPDPSGAPEFSCARSTSVPTGARFDPLVRRVKSIYPNGAVVAGSLYATQPRGGFCWANADDSVSCSVQWQP